MTDFRIPTRFPARSGDIAVNLLRAGSDNQDRCVLRLEGRVDAERLKRTARLILDAEPILGCRFVERFWRPFWERVDDLDATEFFRVVETDDPEREIDRFLLGAIDPADGPQMRVCLVRGETDAVAFRVNHETADGGAYREFLARFLEIYNRLEADPGYVPRPNVGGSRSMTLVARRLSLADKLKVIRRLFRDGRARRKPPGNWAFPGTFAAASGPRIAVRRARPGLGERLRAFGKKAGFSINDLLIAAALRAFRTIIRPPAGTPYRLRMTADQRRWLPGGRGEAMCNMTGGYVLLLEDGAGDPFVETARRVRDRMAVLKDDYIGLGSWVGVPLLKLVPFRWLKRIAARYVARSGKRPPMPPQITNAGVLLTEGVRFGAVEVADAVIAGPMIDPPNLQLNFMTVKGELLMNVSYYASGVDPADVERLFDEVEAELAAINDQPM